MHLHRLCNLLQSLFTARTTDPAKGWGASSAKDKERKRKGSSAADRRRKKARMSGAAAGLPPPPAHPPPALPSTEKYTQTSVNPEYMQALLTDVFTDNIEAVSRAVDLAKKKDLYVRTVLYDSSDSESDDDKFVPYVDKNPTGAGRLWLFEMVPEEMRKNPKVLSLFMDDEEHVPAVTRYMSQAQRCDVNWAEALIYQHKLWSPDTFFDDSVRDHPRIVVALLWVCTDFYDSAYNEHMRTHPDQVACAIYAILHHQCDIDEMANSKPALEIVGGMELDSSQVAKMFRILKQMFATSPSDEISYGMAGLRGSPKLTAEDVLQVKDAIVELLRSVDSDDSLESPMSDAAADDSSDDDDSSNIISLDDSDEEVVPVHKSDEKVVYWNMTTERGTTTVETVEAGYREYEARVE
eukprot:COSAG02_NODE_8047_length_2733_cov_4.237288_5_plen_409_part_00